MVFNTNAWRRINYTLMAPAYDLIVGGLARGRRRSIAMLDLKPGERVLIVGAGTGLDLPLIGPGPHIAAVDLTPAMLERLRRRAARLGLTVEARVMDAQSLDFPEASFDAAVLHLILAVVPDARRCAAEVARVLRPGGRAAVFDKFGGHLLLRAINPVMAALGTNVARQLPRILEGLPLRIVRDEPAGLGGFFRVALLERTGG